MKHPESHKEERKGGGERAKERQGKPQAIERSRSIPAQLSGAWAEMEQEPMSQGAWLDEE